MRFLKIVSVLTIIILLQCCHHTAQKQEKIKLPDYVEIPKGVMFDKKKLFENVIRRYDTIIPIFDGLFITYDKVTPEERGNTVDTLIKYKWLYNSSKEAKKWGVIDSTGNPIVPFICDAIKVISKGKGIATILQSNYTLPTGVPTYKYKGIYFFFTINGKEKSKVHTFERNFIGLDYQEDDVITKGHEYFLPLNYTRK